VTDLSVQAHSIYETLVELNKNLSMTKFKMTGYLKVIRDGKLYKSLGHSSFKEFLAIPELSLNYRTTLGYIQLWERYERLGVPVSVRIDIGAKKGMEMGSALERHPELLELAPHISSSDLLTEVHRVEGKVFASPAMPSPDCTTYEKYVKSQPCIICGRTPVDLAHFPRTKVRADNPWYVIPLCRIHHREQEDGGMAWTWDHRKHWGNYFHNRIGDLLNKLESK